MPTAIPPEERVRAAHGRCPEGFTSATTIMREAGGTKTAIYAAVRAMEASGELWWEGEGKARRSRVGGRPTGPEAAVAAAAAEVDDDPEPAFNTATPEGRAEMYDFRLRRISKLIRHLEKRAMLGESAPGLVDANRAWSEFLRRRAELLPEDNGDSLKPDAELEREILEDAQQIVAGAFGIADPSTIAFAILEEGSHRTVTVERVAAELQRRHAADVKH